MLNEFSIAGTAVGRTASPYVIAEVGSNFCQDLEIARQLIDVAAEAGANAVKFQLFRADKLYPAGSEMHDIFKSIELNPDWVPSLVDQARNRGIAFMASAFDSASVEVLEAVEAPAHKIASSEVTNLSLLHYVASKGKPLIISTGMCDMIDVLEALSVCTGVGNFKIALLQCGSVYPLPVEFANLRVISTYGSQFSCPVGFSDHTLGQTAAVTAVGLGATVFEKHFTLDHTLPGPDHSYALEPKELKSYVSTLHDAHQALGSATKEMLGQEREIGRRDGLFAARELAKGDTLNAEDIVVHRPALGLRSRYRAVLAGARLRKNLAKDEPITWDAIFFDGTE